MNNVDPSYHQKDFTCVKSTMNDHNWNRAQEGHRRQSQVPWNPYHGINEAVSPTLPAAISSNSTFISTAGMSSSNDTSHSTGLQNAPCFLPQQLVWPTMTSTMAMTPSSFYLTSMPGIPSQPAFFIPMPVYDRSYPNNSDNDSSNNSNSNSNNFHFPPHVAATQGSYDMIQPPMILPPQFGMVNTETLQIQSAMYSSSMLCLPSNAFPTNSENKDDPYHACLSLKTQARDDNKSKVKHETNLFGKDDSFLLPPPVCRSSSQSRSVNHDATESSQQQEGEQYATVMAVKSYHCFGMQQRSRKQNSLPPK